MLDWGVILDRRSLKSGVILETTKNSLPSFILRGYCCYVFQSHLSEKNCDLRLFKYRDFGGLILDTLTFYATYLFLTVKFC